MLESTQSRKWRTVSKMLEYAHKVKRRGAVQQDSRKYRKIKREESLPRCSKSHKDHEEEPLARCSKTHKIWRGSR